MHIRQLSPTTKQKAWICKSFAGELTQNKKSFEAVFVKNIGYEKLKIFSNILSHHEKSNDWFGMEMELSFTWEISTGFHGVPNINFLHE